VIVEFADQATADIFHGTASKVARRRLPRELWPAAQRKLDRLNRAREPRDLADPPGNRLEALRGDLAGWYSIRINDQYRIIFRFSAGDASAVELVDYH
jgi:proteic killer suppression protein